VRSGAKHANLLCALRSIKAKYPMTFSYSHVKAHHDQQLPWWALSLVEQLNVTCDTLARQAVTHGLCENNQWCGSQLLLPRESAAVIIDGHKLISNVSVKVHHHLGKAEAQKFITRPVQMKKDVNVGGLGWSSQILT
jgi:hypothetical protein